MSLLSGKSWVKWTSGAKGRVREKVGQIIFILPAGMPVGECLDQLPKCLVGVDWLLHVNRDDRHRSRDHASYIVATEDYHLYWPYVHSLTEITAEESRALYDHMVDEQDKATSVRKTIRKNREGYFTRNVPAPGLETEAVKKLVDEGKSETVVFRELMEYLSKAEPVAV